MKTRILSYLLTSLLCLTGHAQTSGDSLKISVRTTPGAEIGIDTEMSSTNILCKTVSCGKHKVIVTCGPDFKKEFEIDITPSGKTSFEYDIKGRFKPMTKPAKSDIYIDGVKVDGTEVQSLLGIHHIKAYGNTEVYAPYNGLCNVLPLDQEQSEIYVLKKKRLDLSGYVIANYMLRVNAPGMMMGIGRRFGAYIKLNLGLSGDLGGKCPYVRNETQHRGYYELGDKNKFELGDEVHVRNLNVFCGGSAGFSFKPVYFLNLYCGTGYYTYQPKSYYTDATLDKAGYYIDTQSMGLMLEMGMIAKYRSILFQMGYSRGFGEGAFNSHFGEFNLGIGINIQKRKKI